MAAPAAASSASRLLLLFPFLLIVVASRTTASAVGAPRPPRRRRATPSLPRGLPSLPGLPGLLASLPRAGASTAVAAAEGEAAAGVVEKGEVARRSGGAGGGGVVPLPRPRKRELWLPWPLGALRDDYDRFVEAQRSGGGNRDGAAREEWRPLGGGRRPSRDDDDGEFRWGERILRGGERAAGWAGELTGKLAGGGRREDREGSHRAAEGAAEASEPEGRGATTPMATATAIAKKQDRKSKGVRGGESKDEAKEKEDRNDVLRRYLTLQARLRMRQLGYVGSDVSVHLPPAGPILLFYRLLPSRKDPTRRLVRYALAGAALSWLHGEATKYRRFSPLPGLAGINLREPELPPFLPEAWPDDGDDAGGDGSGGGVEAEVASTTRKRGNGATRSKEDDDEGDDETSRRDRQRHHLWDPFQSFGTVSAAYRTWLEGNELRDARSCRRRRVRAQEQLLALRKESSSGSSSPPAAPSSSPEPPGHALITGASGGIGRALAVELARHGMPLILVARDLSKLQFVADDIETHYGVSCKVLRADLSEPGCARKVHAATTRAGLVVDVLVNNAGVCARGDLSGDDDEEEEDVAERMIRVNAMATTGLSRLYGRDMRGRRRGRILVVSSVSGVLPGCPSVGVYAATKAFGRSLANSLGREMERYGVGVTCLLPGAVKGTSFASKSEVEDAVCFHFPGYAKSPELVAREGIKGLMLGYPEVYPGWQNRAFVKMFLPLLPPRASNIIGEWAWNPWQWGDVMPQRPGSGRQSAKGFSSAGHEGGVGGKTPSPAPPVPPPPSSGTSTWKFRRPQSPAAPNQMQLPDVATEKAAKASSEPVAPLLVNPSKGIAADEQNAAMPEEVAVGSPVMNGAEEQVGEQKHNATSVANRGKAERVSAPEPGTVDEGRQIPNQGKDNLDNGEKGSETSAPEPLALPLVLAQPLPPENDHEASKPLVLFGFFDKEQKIPSIPPRAGTLYENGEGTGDKEDAADDDGMVEPRSSPESADPEWYPSMLDKKEYDFRDRRLDY